jgi:branched-chain amino acid transport system substrate-binding protein
MHAFRLLSLSAVAAACMAAGTACADPVKIGVVETLSGPQAASGQMYRAAARYAVERMNAEGGWNGQPVQLLEYDNQGGPAGAADKLKAAIADGVHIVVQGASSAVGGQITEDIRKHNLRNPGKEMIYVNVGAEAQELTGEKCHFHHFRFSGNAPVRTKALVLAMKQSNALGGASTRSTRTTPGARTWRRPSSTRLRWAATRWSRRRCTTPTRSRTSPPTWPRSARPRPTP